MVDGVLSTLAFVTGVAIGWGIHFIDSVLAHFKEKSAREERMSIFDKAITHGDPSQLYQLRVSERAGADKRNIQSAVESEVARRVPETEEKPEPWSNHPVYGKCEVHYNEITGNFLIHDPDGVDGPEVWEVKGSDFWQEIEGGVDKPD